MAKIATIPTIVSAFISAFIAAHLHTQSFNRSAFSGCSTLLALRARGFIKCCPKSLGKLQCIIVCPKVKEDQSRLFSQHVAMYGGDFDAIRPQGLDHWIYLATGKHKIAGNGRL